MDDKQAMRRAMALAHAVRRTTAPNPWVGCVLATPDGRVHEGATAPPGGLHAEAAALVSAGPAARGATAWVTLEPCSHHGRTPPCADALVAAGVRRVVVGVVDADERVAGRGIDRLRAAGIEVEVGVEGDEVTRQLAPYLKHRRTGRPWVVLKWASSVDGRTAAPDGTSQWITGPEARTDAHALRAEADAVVVGAGTVRADDPSLTVRHVEGPDPLRVVLGQAPEGARVHPALELSGEPGAVLDELGRRGVLRVLVEGGAGVAGAFHRAGVVDRYVVYLAPKLFGGDDGRSALAGAGAATMADVWEGRVAAVTQLGADVRLDLVPATSDLGDVRRPEEVPA
ncbi:MAG TPA: bifunctional diaminohydroxyphosphoribosylaminopyrimidine deaminase/5-amino-6-(5-phosphoribosylamino)uracil reductase RibD [Acidimicrobiales bacterium]|nr:bifunctional diaminohydroxyphosphoribosylaminopyrimidine deaminase/5-amino-6-(5-phosphoribosylamino)uracil reductase RibD [Acidimicrobiales bacterium]